MPTSANCTRPHPPREEACETTYKEMERGNGQLTFFGEPRRIPEPSERVEEEYFVEEYFVEVRIDFARHIDSHSEEAADLAEEFCERLSEYLGTDDHFLLLGFCRNGIDTYVYLDADSPGDAAAGAEGMFCEAAELVWGAGTTARAERIVTAEERDRELGEL